MLTTRTHRLQRARRIFLAGALVAAIPVVATSSADAAGHRRVVQADESIQEAIDTAPPYTEILIRGDHSENVWINKRGISLRGIDGASITVPDDAVHTPCEPAHFAPAVCVIPAEAETGFPKPYQFLRDVSVSNLTLNSPNGDGVEVFFTNAIEIKNNIIDNAGCSGVFVRFATGFRVSRNVVTNPTCPGIQVDAASHGSVSGNTTSGSPRNGISLGGIDHASIHGNTSTDNCAGIGIGDQRISTDLSITANVTNENNTACFFGDLPIGGTGILAVGVEGLTIKANTANDNVIEEFSIAAGGIVVGDFPAPDGSPLAISQDVRVTRNTAFGNSSAVGAADVRVVTVGTIKAVTKNRCGVSQPEASWCTD